MIIDLGSDHDILDYTRTSSVKAVVETIGVLSVAKLSQIMQESAYIEAINRFNKVGKLVQRVQIGLAKGKTVISHYNDEEQCKLYEEREVQLTNQISRNHKSDVKRRSVGLERSIGKSKDILSIEFFEAGLLASRPVGYISVKFGAEEGTGFLVGNGLLLTNYHVIPDPDTANTSSVEFNKENNQYGEPKPVEQFDFDPDRFFLPNKALDFTIVAVNEQSGSGQSLSQFNFLPLIPRRGKVRIGDPVNIIQHPGGQEKSVVVHNSNLLHMENNSELESFLWYSSDTEPGSSGSPVFNNRWEVIALHHRAVPYVDNKGRILSVDGKAMSNEKVDTNCHQVRWVANEGVRTSVIVQAVREATFEQVGMEALRDDLVSLWENTFSGWQGIESLRRKNQGAGLSSSFKSAVMEIPLANETSIKITLQLSTQSNGQLKT